MKSYNYYFFLFFFLIIIFSECDENENKKEVRKEYFYNKNDTFLYVDYIVDKNIMGKNYKNKLLVINISTNDTILNKYTYSTIKSRMCYDKMFGKDAVLFCYELDKSYPHHNKILHNNMKEDVEITAKDTVFLSIHISSTYHIGYTIKYNRTKILDISRKSSSGIEL